MQIIESSNILEPFIDKVPTSKSYTNRLLILAAISNGPFTIKNIASSTDVKNMIRCLKNIGLNITENGDDITIINSFPSCEKKSESPIYLETGDGGTTNRFLIPLLARGRNKYCIKPSGKFSTRPVDDLVKPLIEIGASISFGEDDFFISIRGGEEVKDKTIVVNCSKSTQFITGLMLAYANTNLNFVAENLDSSLKYFEMTEMLVHNFNNGKNEFIVPADFSSLSYPAAFAAINNGGHINNAQEIDSFQADSYLFTIFDEIGVEYTVGEEGLTINACENLRPFSCDCSYCPDLTPTLAFLAAFIEGESTLLNLEVLKYKESDRIAWIIKILDSFDVKYSYNQDLFELRIYGSSSFCSKKVSFNAPDDHRIIMAASLFMRKLHGGEISNFKHINKSYPEFANFINKC